MFISFKYISHLSPLHEPTPPLPEWTPTLHYPFIYTEATDIMLNTLKLMWKINNNTININIYPCSGTHVRVSGRVLSVHTVHVHRRCEEDIEKANNQMLKVACIDLIAMKLFLI